MKFSYEYPRAALTVDCVVFGLDDRRPVRQRPSPTAKVVGLPRVGGLHHRYEWRVAA